MTGGRHFARIVPYLMVGAASGYLYHVADHFEFYHRAGILGPDFWPKAILALMIAACAYEIIKRIRTSGPESETAGVLEEIVETSAKTHGDLGEVVESESHPFLLVAGMAWTALYVLVIQRLGFFLATVLYLAIFIVLGGYRRWTVVAATSLVGTLLLFFFFMKVVYVSLPIGEEPFSTVTLFLMRLMGIR